jgi:DNA-binding NarL/FixJ family response regulator
MGKEKIKILIVDDNRLFRKAVKKKLSNELSFEIVGEASNDKEFLKLLNTVEMDIVLMDIQIPELGGIAATKKACFINRNIKVIAVTPFKNEVTPFKNEVCLEKLIESGFKGCVLRNNFFYEIINSIKELTN